ncbi:MAG TPA: zinc ABC transporter substrate-binding protein [Leptolyngbyaceae cyanobacterium M33_DOE_097]|uniref:Cation ABC transporter substrate-binding protein n=1 Tax=Oscillatoriales cyanobacterium SpSt-418 TaxID=2282169 RepID=A0A7C3KFD7_9CYAN|nr:zinc ABC transporter substrate-binding protein [Leptolyngbyaceae cyanobacterium M33_DOE_097]
MADRFKLSWAALLISLTVVSSCHSSSVPTPTSDKLQIVVSILPQKYFVEQIGDRRVNVSVMVPPGAEPHTFEPKPSQLQLLSRADAYMRIRIDFESAWMDKFVAVNPRMLIVDTTERIQRLPISEQSHPQKQATDAGENLDPHIWLSPRLVKIQAQTIYHALVQLDTKHQPEYQTNLQRFLADLDALDAELQRTFQDIKSRKFIVFHPSWGYFARDYHLEQIAIAVGGQEPSPAELARIITITQQAQSHVIFAEPQFNQQSAAAIAREINGAVLLIDPLSPDWMNNMKQVANTFARVLAHQHQLEASQGKRVPFSIYPLAQSAPLLPSLTASSAQP